MRTMSHHPAPTSASRSLVDLLEDWVSVGLITPEQSEAIRQREAAPHERRVASTVATPPGTGPSMVVEALGYLGGVVMLVGTGILVGMYWADLSVALRLTLVGATALALVGAGLAVPDRLGDAAGRLRSVLWAVGVAATAGFLGVLSTEVLDRYDEHALLIVGPGTAVLAGVLWWLRPTWLQQLALFVPVMLAAVGIGLELTSTSSSWGGAAMWVAAVGWAVLSWTGRLEPRLTGVSFGVIGAVMGALMIGADVGIALGLGTAVVTVAVALWERSLPWLGVAALALLWTMPRAAQAWFPGALSAALTLIVTGGALVGAAVWVARHRTDPPSPMTTSP